MRPARPAIASCSSLSAKSTYRLPLPSVSRNSGKAETEQGDQITLHFVGAPAESEDQGALHGALDPPGERGVGLALAQLASGPDHLEQEAVRLGVELGAEDLGRAGDARIHLPGRDLPVDELEVLRLRSHASEVDLRPLLVDDTSTVRQLGLLRPLDHVVVAALDHPGWRQ